MVRNVSRKKRDNVTEKRGNKVEDEETCYDPISALTKITLITIQEEIIERKKKNIANRKNIDRG